MPTSFLPTFSVLDPTTIVQGGVVFIAFVLLFFLLYTLRDIVLRTHSFGYQAVCVLLAGALPGVGFLLYLLIRPARTLKQREAEEMLRELLARLAPKDIEEAAHPHGGGPIAEPSSPDQPSL